MVEKPNLFYITLMVGRKRKYTHSVKLILSIYTRETRINETGVDEIIDYLSVQHNISTTNFTKSNINTVF